MSNHTTLGELTKGKIGCESCAWIGHESELLCAPNPFNGDVLNGCPSCKDVCDLKSVCDEPGCFERDTCGTPTPEGYRRVCGEHYRGLSGKV